MNKALHGLKQEPRSSYVNIYKLFSQQGFTKSKGDPNLDINRDEKGHIVFIVVYVDDLIITGSATSLIEKIKRCLSREFEMNDLEELHNCLGLEVSRDNGKTLVTQSKDTQELIRRFNMNGCKAVSTPLEHKCHTQQ